MKSVITLIGILISSVAISQCGSYSMTINFNQPTCHDFNDGSIFLSTSGGNGGDVYTITDTSGNVLNIGNTANTLPGGWYYCEVTDNNSCYILDSIYIPNPPEMIVQLTLTEPTHADSCNGIAEVDTVLYYNGNYNDIFYQWEPGGPSGMNGTYWDGLCHDDYILTISDDNGCNIQYSFTSGSASILDLKPKKSIKTFPNPATEYFSVMNNDDTLIESITIFSVSGKQILVIDEIKEKMNISHLKSGEYVLLIKTKEKGNYQSRLTKR